VSAVALPALATPSDRLRITLLLAVVAHCVLILGVTFAPEDRDLLDLLAAHAASALLAARMYSATDRKLKTLENLVKLVR